MKENKFIVLSAFFTGISFVMFISTFYGTFSLDNSKYKFESEVYSISDNYIENVSVNTEVELFFKYFNLENCDV